MIEGSAAAGGTGVGGARKSDPTENPITRRPGPGRGRPRKQPPVPVGDATPGSDPSQPATGPAPEGVSEAATVSGPSTDAMAIEDAAGEDDLEEQPSKRPRLEDNTDPALTDEAVLSVLGAHSNPDHYGQE